MHHESDPAYEWPTCSTPSCGRQLWVRELGRRVCRPCETSAQRHLADLPGLFAELNRTATLIRGAGGRGVATSGSRTPPIPPRLDVLALTGPGGVGARLAAVEDSWRTALGWTVAPWRGSPVQAVPEHVRFLVNNLPWACSEYESVGDDVVELRRLAAECRAALDGSGRPGRVRVGSCPAVVEGARVCGEALTATAENLRIRCRSCGARWETLEEWRALREAQQHVLVERERAAA
ncbi:hypothetical protein [Streptomyces sp. NPDC047315]|uniref:hypothetical protein n=1 Tax=Streptomyces sp. NPDC047315 TaxID=3155142 RepID=UPI0033C62EF0